MASWSMFREDNSEVGGGQAGSMFSEKDMWGKLCFEFGGERFGTGIGHM